MTALLICKEVLVSNQSLHSSIQGAPRHLCHPRASKDALVEANLSEADDIRFRKQQSDNVQFEACCAQTHLTNGSAVNVEAKSIKRFTQKIQTIDLRPEDFGSLNHGKIAS
uniref:Uncharacterized protein n=1 Tax=Ascaris lumbricoides TaxID=6252 RepID=A0A0M3ITW5_ASCLU